MGIEPILYLHMGEKQNKAKQSSNNKKLKAGVSLEQPPQSRRSTEIEVPPMKSKVNDYWRTHVASGRLEL